jgi:N-acylneuraminate cytidylyltransferase
LRCFDEIVLSSEDDRILSIGKKFQITLHKRNSHYSTDYIPMSDVYRYLASEVNGDVIAWIQVNNPLVNPQRYEEAINVYNNLSNGYDCLLSVSRIKEYLFYEGKPVGFKPYPWPRSQDLKGFSKLNFAICILKREDMIKWGSLVGNSPYFYYGDSIEFHDIDTPEDFLFCETIYKSRAGKEQETL